MRKGLGRLQQIRGHKRRQKVVNRRLNRNPSDIASVDYSDRTVATETEMVQSNESVEKENERINS